MQKIIIKNFGPVKDAEIELKKVLVLIGEQASGKSTIAKLVYFFRSLRENLLGILFGKREQNITNLESKFEERIKEKFTQWFEANLDINLYIRFYYDSNSNKYIDISTKKNLTISLSKNLLDLDFTNTLSQIVEEMGVIYKEEELWTQLLLVNSTQLNRRLQTAIDKTLNISQNNNLFAIAGRSITISHSELFEKYLFSNLQQKILEKIATADDILTYEFLNKIVSVKEKYIASIDIKSNNGKINKAQKMSPILKGQYLYNTFGEMIFLDNGRVIPISQASSGQQEALRILQDIYVLLDNKATKAFRVIEEPEAHLFPIAQKQLVELFALMVNQNEHNQLIITTHSPYILSAFNNLLFAQRVVDKNPAMEAEVSEVIDKAYHLKGDDFAAYSLGNTSFAKGEYAYCESIVNPKTQLIAQNYLDEVSAMLGAEFNTLYELHAKKFARA